jgi:hypothetical protein
LCLADCREVLPLKIGSTNMCRRVARLICTPNNQGQVRLAPEPVAVMAWKERSTIDDRRRNS